MTAPRPESAADCRIVPLEAVRGIAAVVVVVYHGMLAFAPQVFTAGKTPLQLARNFVFGLANGGAAVTVFFVLSGFVLSLPFVSGRGRVIGRVGLAMAKRWPRLAGLTVLGCLFAWMLVRISGDAYAVAGHISGADWLTSHANAPLSPAQRLSWFGAIHEGLVSVFTRGDVQYDSALWTMRIELFCSLVIFLLAPALAALRRWRLRAPVLACAALLSGAAFPPTYLTDFLCGLTLALLASEGRLPNLDGKSALLLSAVVLLSFGFSGAGTFRLYAPVRAILPAGDSNHFVWEIGAIALMVAVLGYQPIYRTLSRPWASRLGVLSFPLYVVHVPILLSLGAASFIRATTLLGPDVGIAIATMATLAASIGCAIPLAWADRHWCRAIGLLTRGAFMSWAPKMGPRA